MLRAPNTKINMISPYPPVAYSLEEEIGRPTKVAARVIRPRQRCLPDSGLGAGVERWLERDFQRQGWLLKREGRRQRREDKYTRSSKGLL